MSATERNIYLKWFYGQTDRDSFGPSDSDYEDWIPAHIFTQSVSAHEDHSE